MANTSTSTPLVFGDGAVTLNDPTPDILLPSGGVTYKKGTVGNTEDVQSSFWVVYDKKHYGTAEGMEATSYLVPRDPLNPSDCQTSEMPKGAISAQGFDVLDPAIILFEHPYYIGNAAQFSADVDDLMEYFPTGDGWSGVSSVIVTGGKWELYGNTNQKQPLLGIVSKGLFEFKGQDRVKSIRRTMY